MNKHEKKRNEATKEVFGSSPTKSEKLRVKKVIEVKHRREDLNEILNEVSQENDSNAAEAQQSSVQTGSQRQ